MVSEDEPHDTRGPFFEPSFKYIQFPYYTKSHLDYRDSVKAYREKPSEYGRSPVALLVRKLFAGLKVDSPLPMFLLNTDQRTYLSLQE